MGKYYITEVKTNKDIKQWLDFPARLYKNDPHYVKPLDDEIEAIFDKSKNNLTQKRQYCPFAINTTLYILNFG